MSNLQTLSEPVNQTAFAKAVRLGTQSILDAAATTGTERFDNLDMARRWLFAAQGYTQGGSKNEQAILAGLRTMLTAFNPYL